MLTPFFRARSAAVIAVVITSATSSCFSSEAPSSDPFERDDSSEPGAILALDASAPETFALDSALTHDARTRADEAIERHDASFEASFDASFAPAPRDAQAEDAAPAQTAPCVPNARQFERVFDPSEGRLWPWYYNDHTFIRDRDGLWHLFGITHPEPAAPHLEREFGHATSPSLASATWTRQSSPLFADTDGGETVLWAPYVIEVEGTYYMFYCAGGEPDRFQIKLATSPDLITWIREPEPLFTDGVEARDPFVIRIGERWVMYYTANSEPSGGNHVVAYRVSDDLRHWSERMIAFSDPRVGTVAGPTESPFVVARPEGYYLFTGPRNDYVSTEVFFSHDPFHFEPTPIAAIESHAPELITDTDGAWYISHAGWGQGGVYLSPLEWKCDP